MKTKLYIDPFKDRCPTVDEFERFLKQKGSKSFNVMFIQHLESCPFCAEALEGYHHAGIRSIKPVLRPVTARFVQQTTWRKTWRYMGYAASIILLLGTFWFYKEYSGQHLAYLGEQDHPIFMYRQISVTDGTKKLNHKSTDEYWYIGNSNLEVNDQVIHPDDIEKTAHKNQPGSAIVIEVESTDEGWVDKLIQKIQKGKDGPVFTFSKQKIIRRT